MSGKNEPLEWRRVEEEFRVREIVTAIIEESDQFRGYTTRGVESSPLAFPYLDDALALERPGWRAFEATGGRAAAVRYAPCLYVSFRGERPRIMRLEKIER